MNEFDYTVSLRIRHPSIDPTKLTTMLGFAPQYSWRAGDRKPEVSSESGSPTYRETYWLGRLPSPGADIPDLPFENAIMLAVLHIQRIDESWNELVATGGSAHIIVEIFGGRDLTLDLSPGTLAMLARFGVAISVDVHTEMQAVA